MKPKTMILVVVAVACGLGASYMTARLLAERQPVEEEKVRMLVARRQLNFGERIANPEELFEVKEVAKESLPPDAITEFDALKGKRLRAGRNKGDHVTPGNLYDKDTVDIPEGYKLAGLSMNLATTAHGLATLPGSRVDLILTMRGNNPGETRSMTLLENVLVIAADGRVNREGEIIAPASVVTFALNEEELLTVNTAKEIGTITLSLRKLNDTTAAKVRSISGHDILHGKKKDEPQEPKVKPAPVETASSQPMGVEKQPTPEKKKYTRHEIVVVNGAERGQRTVQKTVYFQTEDGQIFFDEQEASQVTPPASGNPAPPADKGSFDF